MLSLSLLKVFNSPRIANARMFKNRGLRSKIHLSAHKLLLPKELFLRRRKGNTISSWSALIVVELFTWDA